MRGPAFACLVLATLASCGARYQSAARTQYPYPGPTARTVLQAEAAAPAADFTGELVAGILGEGDGGASSVPPAPPMATSSAVRPPAEMMVVEGWLRLAVSDVKATAEAIRAQVTAAGGNIVQDELSGAGKGTTNGSLKLRLPPAQVAPFLTWVAAQGELEFRRIQGTDVSREYFDRELALANNRLTLGRLQKLFDNPNLDTKSVLEIEKEMTRVRGEIEQMEGAQRFLVDRAAMATIDIALVRRGGAVFGPEAKLHPGLRGFFLFDISGDATLGGSRPGLGLNLHVNRWFTIDLDFAPVDEDRPIIVLATMGLAIYSDFLGAGERTFLNPYIGLRVGAGANDGAQFVAEGELGLELLKTKAILIETQARLVGLISEDSSAKLQVTLGASVPF